MALRNTSILGCALSVLTLMTTQRARAQETTPPAEEPQAAPKEPAYNTPPPVPPQPSVEPPKEAEPEKPNPDVGYVTITRTGGFRIRSSDGNYMLRFGLSLGLKYEPVWTDGHPVPNPLLSFVRPVIRGNFFRPWIEYFTSFELASPEPFLLSANVLVEPWDEFGVRVGQQGTPLSRHTSTGPRDIFFVDYASVPSYFWSGRQRGLTFHGEVGNTQQLEYWAGIYGGSPTRAADDPHNYIAEARATINPFGLVNEEELPFTPDGKELPANFSFTLQGYHGKLNVTKENIDPTISPLDPAHTILTQTMTTAGADIWLQWWRFILTGEYYRRYQDSTPLLPGYVSEGAWGQLIASVYADKIGVGGRVNWIAPNSHLPNDDVIELEGQVAWWIAQPALSLKLRYAYLHQNSPDAAQLASFPGFVLPFTPGPTQVGTLQLTLVY